MGRIIGRTITLFLLAISSQACGMSIGDTHVGSTGYVTRAMEGRNVARRIIKEGGETVEETADKIRRGS